MSLSRVRKILKKLEVPESDRYGQPTRWLNYDIIPMTPSRRKWTNLTYIGLWNTGNFTPGSWARGASLMSLGLSIGQTMGLILVTNTFVVVTAILNGWPGSKYNIGFTVLQRQVFGIYGSYLTMAMRTILSMVWFASQSWMGGLSFCNMFSALSPAFKNMKNTFPDSVHFTSQELCGFVVFQLVVMVCLLIKPEKVHTYVNISNLYNFILMFAIMIWARTHAGTLGPLADLPTKPVGGESLGWVWMYGMSSFYGGIAAGVTNQSDYTRFSVTRYSSLVGCAFGLGICAALVPLMGIVTSSSLQAKYGVSLWNPVDIINLWMENDYSAGTRAASFFAALGFIMTQLACNTFENGFSGGMDMSGMAPKYITILRGSMITALVSWVVQPWLFYNTASVFVTVMSSFSVFMIPLISILITDFFLVRKKSIYLVDLFSDDKDSKYYFTYGVNWRAMFAWFATFSLNMPGMIHQITPTITVGRGIYHYYYGNVYFGFAIAMVTYYTLCRIWPIEGAGGTDSADYFGTFTDKEAEAVGMIPHSQLTNEEIQATTGVDLRVFDHMERVGREIIVTDSKVDGPSIEVASDVTNEKPEIKGLWRRYKKIIGSPETD